MGVTPGGSPGIARSRGHFRRIPFHCNTGYCIIDFMIEYRFTEYFEKEVLRKRPYLKKEWCVRVVQNPFRVEPQEHNRFRFWGEIEELGGRVLRVITLLDKGLYIMPFPTGGLRHDAQLLP